MNVTVVNILESSPTYFLQQQVSFDEFVTLKFLILSFDLILLSTLNHAKLPQISLFSLYLESFFTEIKLKVSNDFDFHRMKYDSYIDLVFPGEFVEKSSVQIDNYHHEENKVQKIKIKYDFKEHDNLKSIKKTKIKFNIGNFNNQQHSKAFGKFSIENLTCSLESNRNLRKNEQNQIALVGTQSNQLICNHEDEGGSFPVLYMNEYGNLKSQSQTYFIELIQNLEPYNASDTSSKPNHLFICHDMKEGYYQDTKFTDPVEKIRKNSYRFNFLWYTSVFNYFSHKTITVPPRHWREVCKRFQVKCLGTFIVENGRVDEAYFLTNQFALKLVYLAKKYKFDGYLINIENEIRDIEALKKWLGFLTNKIHIQIPGSMISWYDSVTTSGTVEYQNQINDKNKIFYDLTDSFYTNYWWTDQMLKKDLSEALPNKTIYVGNDVWGRGTYGGGQFYLYKAIDQIQKNNRPNQPNLVPALFAPGYTYESGGQNNNHFLKANEDRLYRGVVFENQQIKEWKQFQENQKTLLNLKRQKQWFGKYYSLNLWEYSSKGKLKITFMYRVNSTLSENINKSDYKILMRLKNTLLNQTIQQSQVQKKDVTLLLKEIKKVQIIVDTKKITPKTDLEIYVSTSIKDIFDEQKLLVSFYLQNIDWVQEVPVTKLQFNSQYNSFLNMGYGDYFYFNGKPILKNYNFLADYDMPPIASLNHPFSTDIQHDDAYIGGSSLVLHQSIVKLFFIQLPNYQHNYPHSYQAKVVKKGGNIESFYFSQSSGFSVFLTKIQEKSLQNGWTELTYQISAVSMKKMKKKFFKDLETSLMMDIKQKCLIGQIYLQPQFLNDHQRQKQMLQLSISQSFRTQNKDQIFIDIDLAEISLKSAINNKKIHNRYLIVIDEQFSAFIYMDKQGASFRGKLRQIKLNVNEHKNMIQIYDVGSDLNEKLLLEQKDINFSSLKGFSISHKINIKNY